MSYMKNLQNGEYFKSNDTDINYFTIFLQIANVVLVFFR